MRADRLRRLLPFWYKLTYRVTAIRLLSMIRKTAVKQTKPAAAAPPSKGRVGTNATAGVEVPSPAKIQLKTYEEAIRLFSHRKLTEALERFIEAAKGPDAHVADKARSYAQVCERRTVNVEPQLQTSEDHFNYGVERLNSRDFDRALHHFERALALQPNAEHVCFTMALCCGLAGDGAGAYENLKRAIDLEPRNRILARQDPEFLAILPQFPNLRALLLESSPRA
jgi:tetratricopeptide (TPR) repeat protein